MLVTKAIILLVAVASSVLVRAQEDSSVLVRAQEDWCPEAGGFSKYNSGWCPGSQCSVPRSGCSLTYPERREYVFIDSCWQRATGTCNKYESHYCCTGLVEELDYPTPEDFIAAGGCGPCGVLDGSYPRHGLRRFICVTYTHCIRHYEPCLGQCVEGEVCNTTQADFGRCIPQPISSTGSALGDPHFKTWSGFKYDYHGGCDLVLVYNPWFADGLGIRVHIRTNRLSHFSFIERGSVQIGFDVLEFTNNVDKVLINGKTPRKDDKNLTLGGFEVRRFKTAISIRLDNNLKAKIDFRQHKSGWIGVAVDGSTSPLLQGSLGLLGEWGTGKLLGRDGVTEFSKNNTDSFATHWQVNYSEPMLFQYGRHPQHPFQCLPPKKKPISSRLGMSHMKEKAEKACAQWKGDDRDDCIFDVMNSRNMAAAEAHVDLEGKMEEMYAAY